LKIGVFADKGLGKWLVQSSFNLPKHILTHKHETILSIKNAPQYLKRWIYDNEKLTHVDFYPLSLAEFF
jgi:hypothetical protein